jgi:hypothetical protein
MNLNGISEGAAYGDDAQMSTNFPLVRFECGGTVTYGRTFGWAPGTVGLNNKFARETQFTVPSNVSGACSLVVAANGIPSAPLPITVTGGVITGAPDCARIKATGLPLNASYTLYLGGDLTKSYRGYCDAAGNTYLTLPTFSGQNFSQELSVNGGSVTTNWQKLRFDPATLTIDPTDYQFSQSTGYIPGWNWTHVAYGSAGDCAGGWSQTGRANVNLMTLPFAVTATWQLSGYIPAGSATMSQNNQVVDATGGGICGGESPSTPFTLQYIGY